MDSDRRNLFVADPDQKKIFHYALAMTTTAGLTVNSKQNIAVNNVQARWIAVDHAGDIYFTDEDANVIKRLKYASFLKRDPLTTETLYDGTEVTAVRRPGGIAVDNFNVFWTNKGDGTDAGSLVRATENPPDYNVNTATSALADNSPKAYGVCLQLDDAYYTENGHVYGIKKDGGEVATVSASLKKPRGCTSDHEGTVYVADRVTGVYMFPANMERMKPQPLQKILNFEDCFGLALFSMEWTGAELVEQSVGWRARPIAAGLLATLAAPALLLLPQ